MADVSTYLEFEGGGLQQEMELSQSFTHGSEPMESMKEIQSSGCILSREDVHQGLSQLGYTADGTKLVFLRLTLPDHCLVDVNLLCMYPYIQYLELSHNKLKDVSSLSALSNLTYLNVSHNNLTTLLDFTPPINLSTVDYSYNEIEEIPDLSSFDFIKTLILDGNQITELRGFSKLQCLTYFSISDNRIEIIQGLDHLPLTYLNLCGNILGNITGLETLRLLQTLNLAGNHISSLQGLSGHPYLSDLNIEENEKIKEFNRMALKGRDYRLVVIMMIMDLSELQYLQDLTSLTTLSLKKNPLQALGDYRQRVIIQLPSVVILDGQRLSVEEKVSARNRHSPPMQIRAGHDHIQLMSKAARRPARLRFSTLTQLDEPYPMLVLCGPRGSGKGFYTQSLVEEFSSFFGLGVSHTTRPQQLKESHGRDYYFINEATFKRAADAGEFIQTCQISSHWYGLTMAVIEQVAQQGLACVTHMTLEGVLSLKQSHFEPRYILTMPLTTQIHQERLHTKDYLTDNDIAKALNDVQYYREYHQEKPGFFDATINTDSLHDGYNILRSVVMAYGGISPETPLTLSLSASRPTTQQSSTSLSTFDIHDNPTTQPTTAVASTLLPSNAQPFNSSPIPILLAQSWSRPSSTSSTNERPQMKKSLTDQGTQREDIPAAAEDIVPSAASKAQDVVIVTEKKDQECGEESQEDLLDI